MNGDSTTPSWYYAKAGAVDGQQVGPVSWEQLYALAQSGALDSADLLWNPQLPTWVPAGEIPGLVAPPRPQFRDFSQETDWSSAAQPAAPQTTAVKPAAAQPAVAQRAAESREATRSATPFDSFLDDSDLGPAGGRRWLRWVIPAGVVVVLAGVGLGVYFGVFRGAGSTDTTMTTLSPVETSVVSDFETTTTEESSLPGTEAVWADLAPAGEVPSVRNGHAAVYNSNTTKMLLFGGWDENTTFNDTWAYDATLNTWADLGPTGTAPAARAHHQMVYDPVNNKVFLFGGLVAPAGAQLGDTWAYDPVANTWTNLNPSGDGPEARDSHSMVYDPESGRVILFGGWSDGTGAHLNDTWAYDPAANTWTNLNPGGEAPSVRGGHCMVYDPSEGKIVLFGGWDENTYFNDTWAYDPAANTWTNLSPAGDAPSPRLGHRMAYDASSSTVVLFGGWDGISEFDDTWAYDAVTNTWTNLNPAGTVPPARDSHSLIFNEATEELILFGGYVDGAADLQDTWSFGIQGAATTTTLAPGTTTTLASGTTTTAAE